MADYISLFAGKPNPGQGAVDAGMAVGPVASGLENAVSAYSKIASLPAAPQMQPLQMQPMQQGQVQLSQPGQQRLQQLQQSPVQQQASVHFGNSQQDFINQISKAFGGN